MLETLFAPKEDAVLTSLQSLRHWTQRPGESAVHFVEYSGNVRIRSSS